MLDGYKYQKQNGKEKVVRKKRENMAHTVI